MKYSALLALALLFAPLLKAQSDSTVRLSEPAIYGLTAGTLAASFVLLDQAWYDQYEKSSFHFFDDGPEWAGMDKAGHVFSTYSIGRYSTGAFKWAGLEERKAIWLGTASGFMYTLSIELLDGRSADWGFSLWDMGANAVGSGLYLFQELHWAEQRILPKYSAHRTDLAPLRPDLLGQGLAEELFKDYNGQTYWLSYSPFKQNGTSWLNKRLLCFSVGYGVENMLGARDNSAVALVPADLRFSSIYLSLDLDLTKIKSRSKFVRTALFFLNGLKVPAPALEFGFNGNTRLHGFYF